MSFRPVNLPRDPEKYDAEDLLKAGQVAHGRLNLKERVLEFRVENTGRDELAWAARVFVSEAVGKDLEPFEFKLPLGEVGLLGHFDELFGKNCHTPMPLSERLSPQSLGELEPWRNEILISLCSVRNGLLVEGPALSFKKTRK